MKIFACALIFLTSFLSPTQQPAGGHLRQGWTVTCPAGQHLDQDCVDDANSDYADQMLELNEAFSQAMNDEQEQFEDLSSFCDEVYDACISSGGSITECATGQSQCLTDVLQQHSQNVTTILSDYNSLKADIQHNFVIHLQSCCR